jgi:hypothetical protein
MYSRASLPIASSEESEEVRGEPPRPTPKSTLLARGRKAPNARLEHPQASREAGVRPNLIAIIAVLAWAAFVYVSYLLGLR